MEPMGISDLIASFLQESLEEAEDGVLEIQRSDLAQRSGAAVSRRTRTYAAAFRPVFTRHNRQSERRA